MDTIPRDIVIPSRPVGEPRALPRSHRVLHYLLQLLVPAVILLFILIGLVTGYLQNWLWMRQLHYTGIFWTLLSVQWTMFAAAFVIVFLFMWINLRQALRYSGATGDGKMRRPVTSRGQEAARLQHDQIEFELSHSLMQSGIIIASLLVAWFAAEVFFSQWDSFLRFRYGGSFGVADPLFGTDVGFYVFRLPFYQMLQTSALMLTIVTMLWGGGIYLLKAGLSGMVAWRRHAASHLSVLLFIMTAILGWGFWLDHYELVYSRMGVVYGAGFTADHVTRIALWVMVVVSAVACAALAFNVLRPRLRLLATGVCVYVAIYAVGVFGPGAVPAIRRGAERACIRDAISEKLYRLYAQSL